MEDALANRPTATDQQQPLKDNIGNRPTATTQRLAHTSNSSCNTSCGQQHLAAAMAAVSICMQRPADNKQRTAANNEQLAASSCQQLPADGGSLLMFDWLC